MILARNIHSFSPFHLFRDEIVGSSMAQTLNPEALSSLSPEYLAEDCHEIWWRWNIALTVLITVVYGLFNISRVFFAKYNGWEIWTLYPLSYVSCIGLCILYFCECPFYLSISYYTV